MVEIGRSSVALGTLLFTQWVVGTREEAGGQRVDRWHAFSPTSHPLARLHADTSSRSRSAESKKGIQMEAVVVAIHRRGRVRVGVKVGDTIRKESIPFVGRSGDEAVLLGWVRGVEIAREMGAQHVTFIVNRKVLEGHLRLGWQVRSLDLLRVWREFSQITEGLQTAFKYRTRERNAAIQRATPTPYSRYENRSDTCST